MQVTLGKNEIINILHTYAGSLFRDSSNVIIELYSKPKSGVYATITVPSSTEVPVETPALEVVTTSEEVKEKKKSPPPLETFIVQEDEPEEENKDNVVTSGSLFSKIG